MRVPYLSSLSQLVDVHHPDICPAREVVEDLLEDLLGPLRLAHLELELPELGRDVHVVLRLQVLQAPLQREPRLLQVPLGKVKVSQSGPHLRLLAELSCPSLMGRRKQMKL